MRSSAVLALAVLATAGPAFAAPISSGPSTSTFTSPSPSAPAPSDSGAISLGTIGSIASFGIPIISGIIDHFKNNGNQQQRREALQLEELFARADADESGALKLGTIGSIASVGIPIISGIIDHFTNSGNQRRDALDLEALFARAEVDESGALKLGDAANIASIGSSIVSVFHNIFGGSDSQQRRELMDILARADVDESGALKLGDAANIASIGSSIVSAFHNIFGGDSQRREFMELLTRTETDDSGALSLGTLSTIFSVGAPVIGGIIDHFKNSGSQQQRRDAVELEQLLARADVDESGALNFGSIIKTVLGLFGGSNSSSNQQRSEFADLLARDDTDESGALKLGTIGSIASVGIPIISGIIDHFKNNGSQQQRRDALALEEVFARAEVDESGALKLPSLSTLSNIGSIGGSAISILHNIFGGSSDSQTREFMEILSRDDTDESGALKLGTIGSIASVGIPIISGLIDHFTGGDQQQRRELEDVLARSVGGAGPGGLRLLPIFKPASTRSLNDLD
ncbi:hypothetical protein PHLCEN_2v1466 [Hermanssonia centrifuga]|uniref:EF-hand domain-containing protein n=1 Tax=Hermanssonia centrifuga TaxID=98765 RepID=A0A2R6S021_9APHY|nr:hypothetical protein PHLCEN_2v1466 [Hermanssonia centrifuga]